MKLAKELMERRVPHAALFYFGACWGLLEFSSFLEGRFGTSAAVTDVLLAVAVVMLPATLIVVWRHGRPGPDPWGRLELGVLAASSVVALVVSSLVVRGQPTVASAVAEIGHLPISDADAEPPQGASTSDEPPDPAEPGLAIAEALEQHAGGEEPQTALACASAAPLAGELDDESQHLRTSLLSAAVFVATNVRMRSVRPIWVTARARSEELGAGREPIASRDVWQLAKRAGCERVVTGTISQDDEGLHLSVEIERDVNEVEARRQIDGGLFEVINGLAEFLSESFADPEGGGEVLRAQDALTESEEALRAYLEAIDGYVQDQEFVLRRLSAAAGHDPTFAAADLAWISEQLFKIDNDKTIRRAERALESAYRLPKRYQTALAGHFFFANGQIDRAERLAEQAVQADEADVSAWGLLVQARLYQGDLSGASAAIDGLAQAAPGDIAVFREARLLCLLLGLDEVALDLVERAIELRPDDPELLISRADVLSRLGRFDQARASLEDAAVIDPGNFRVEGELAGIEVRAGDPQQGLAAHQRLLERVSRLDADDADRLDFLQGARLERATWLAMFGRTDELVELSEQIIEELEARPSRVSFVDEQVRVVVVSLLSGSGELEAARRVADGLPPADGAPLLGLLRASADVNIVAGEFEQARRQGLPTKALLERRSELVRELRELVQAVPSKPAQCSVEMSIDYVREAWEPFLDRYDGCVEQGAPEFGRLQALVGAEKWTEALEVAREELEAFPNNPEALWGLGLAHEGLGQWDEAIAAWERLEGVLKGADPDFVRRLDLQTKLDAARKVQGLLPAG